MRAKRHKIAFGTICAIAAVAISSEPGRASDPANSPPSPQMVACMAKILRNDPALDQVRVGVSRQGRWLVVDGQKVKRDWHDPFLEYRISNRMGQRQTIRFEMQGSGLGGYYFETMLNGLHVTGTTVDDWGTGKVIAAWRARCGAAADAVYN